MNVLVRHSARSVLAGSPLGGSFVPGGLVLPQQVDLLQLRGRKRALKQGLTRQQKLDRRLKREAKEAARKEFSFMERIQRLRMKNMVSPSLQYPGRLKPEDEASLPDKPTTNFYFLNSVKTQFLSIPDALNMHREMQRPSMYNNPDAAVRLRMELNMNTEKATKPVANSEEIVPVPFPFEHHEKRAILAFARDPKLQEEAVEFGAEIAIGQDMIKKIIKGQFRIDDYDFCVSHMDMAPFILPLRGVLRSRFPNKINGGLGEDLKPIIEKFKRGLKLTIKGDPIVPNWGLSDVIVGKLSMKDEELEANIQSVVEATCKHRSPALGSFINRAVLMVVPGTTFFPLDIKAFEPIASEEEIEKFEKRTSKKRRRDREREREKEKLLAEADEEEDLKSPFKLVTE